jgi:hypothetical protein
MCGWLYSSNVAIPVTNVDRDLVSDEDLCRLAGVLALDLA